MANNYRPVITHKQAEVLHKVIEAGMQAVLLNPDEMRYLIQFFGKISERVETMRFLERYQKTLPDLVEKTDDDDNDFDPTTLSGNEVPNPKFAGISTAYLEMKLESLTETNSEQKWEIQREIAIRKMRGITD